MASVEQNLEKSSHQLPDKLIVTIHDLHPWGGQDKSNLEILYHMNQRIPLEIHSYSFIDDRAWPMVNHIKYSCPIQRPAFLKSLYFSLMSTLRQLFRTKSAHTLSQTIGTASPIADVVQVQFIHKTWNHIIKEFNIPDSENWLKNIYHTWLSNYNMLNEELFFSPKKNYIAVSHSIKKELMEHFHIPSEKIHTIYHGVNTNYFFPYQETPASLETRTTIRNVLNIPAEATVLLHVGAFNQRKGIYNTIKALGYLQRQGVENIYLIAVGDGDKKQLVQLAQKENVSSQIKIISHSKNVRDYYWASDIFFFPTIYEPFGLVILEAMACGLTCMLSGNAGATELITDGENGIIFKNIFDPESLAHDILSVVKSPQLQKSLRHHAHLSAQKRSWEHVAKEYLDLYEKLD